MLIRLYDIELKDAWKSLIEDKPLLKSVYEAHGELKPFGSYEFKWNCHPSANKEEWDKVMNGGTDNERKALIDLFPQYAGFRTTVSQSKYLSLMEENFDSDRIRLKFVNVHEFDPDDATTSNEMAQYREQVDILNRIISKSLENLKQASELSWNTKVQVPVNTWLNNVNEMCLLEDCCTDALQGYLNEDWRMVAVCPQPDQRRPDYILGRVNTDIGKQLPPKDAYR
jgi:hypothetical protein